MVCDMPNLYQQKMNKVVLILILLEYGLRPMAQRMGHPFGKVLILILLEYGLRHKEGKPYAKVLCLS